MSIGIWLIGVAVLGVVIHLFGQADHAQPADVIIVLGAGLQDDSTPTKALQRRAEYAARLWHDGLAPVIICTGGVTSERVPLSEASGCAEILRAHAVPEAAIVLEERSRSTEENAAYAKIILAQNRWQTAILVSDSYHMLRARWLFESAGITVYTSPVPASDVAFGEYIVAVAREVGAFHWQALKNLLHLPFTYVPLV